MSTVSSASGVSMNNHEATRRRLTALKVTWQV